MITVLKVNKINNRIVNYTCTDGRTQENLSKEQLIGFINKKMVSNARLQIYKGRPIIRTKAVSNEIAPNITKNTATATAPVNTITQDSNEYKGDKQVYFIMNGFYPGKMGVGSIMRLGPWTEIKQVAMLCSDLDILRNAIDETQNKASFKWIIKSGRYGYPEEYHGYNGSPKWANTIYKSKQFNGWYIIYSERPYELLINWAEVIGIVNGRVIVHKDNIKYAHCYGYAEAYRNGTHPAMHDMVDITKYIENNYGEDSDW